ncbi:hypothetical protein RRG08_052027 [Elysia crispata]|uniref:Uncharacterized protein n=1 Tax=Elysia crispata TaxID=231223 RepID=A0AAE1D0V6_9GAST|nr:hypothetical protein RRG08_052027 [Elysia crispata]
MERTSRRKSESAPSAPGEIRTLQIAIYLWLSPGSRPQSLGDHTSGKTIHFFRFIGQFRFSGSDGLDGRTGQQFCSSVRNFSLARRQSGRLASSSGSEQISPSLPSKQRISAGDVNARGVCGYVCFVSRDVTRLLTVNIVSDREQNMINRGTNPILVMSMLMPCLAPWGGKTWTVMADSTSVVSKGHPV